MSLDWLTNLLPILNSTGIPLLAIGVILLVRAYQKSIETYKETSSHLTEENKRLRERLRAVDAGYFDEVEKMKGIVSKSIDAIGELQARKVALLSEPEDSSRESMLSDIRKIDRAIELMQELLNTHKEFKNLFGRHTVYVQEELSEIGQRFQSLAIQVGELAGQIGDTTTRVTVVGLLTTGEALEKLKSETAGHKRGITVPEKLSPPKLPSSEQASLPSSIPTQEESEHQKDRADGDSKPPQIPSAT